MGLYYLGVIVAQWWRGREAIQPTAVCHGKRPPCGWRRGWLEIVTRTSPVLAVRQRRNEMRAGHTQQVNSAISSRQQTAAAAAAGGGGTMVSRK